MARFFLLAVTGAVGFASFLVSKLARRIGHLRRDDPSFHFMLPRLLLLQALLDKLDRLPSLIGPADWQPFASAFVQILEDIKGKVKIDAQDFLLNTDKEVDRAAPVYATLDKIVVTLSKTIDENLIPFLQHHLYILLEDCLPRREQSWRDFLRQTLIDPEERELGFRDDFSPEEKVENFRACFSAMNALEKHIKGLKISDPKRGAPDNVEFLSAPDEYKRVKVFYATDRQVTEDCEYKGARTRRGSKSVKDEIYTSGKADFGNSVLHYGLTAVGVPSKHVRGTLEVPRRNEEADPLSHVVIISIDTTLRGSEVDFVKAVNAELNEIRSNADYSKLPEALIYVHGYNVRFKDAMKRAAQLKCDLQFSGVMITYSWSSKGRLYGYDHDAKTVLETVECLQGFIKLCTSQLKAAGEVHVLAHSMGNRALIAALTALASGDGWGLQSPLRHVILAAADETCQKFADMLKLVRAKKHDKPPHFSVYCSWEDYALVASRAVNLGARLGHSRSFLFYEGVPNATDVDIIDATGVDVSKLHHSYYGDVPCVLKDMQLLLEKGFLAGKRADEKHAIEPVLYRDKAFYAFFFTKLHLKNANLFRYNVN